MKLRRTANAGFLLELDGAVIALDSVCREVAPYLATPPAERARILDVFPDILAFTHGHDDHFDPTFAKCCPGPIMGPVAQAFPGKNVLSSSITVKGVRITQIPTRHIGKVCLTEPHASFVIKGSGCVWFMGDAGPAQMAALANCPRPDVLIAPFAYATTPSAVRMVHAAGPKMLVLTHLPSKDFDPDGLWAAVENMLPGFSIPVQIPYIGESLAID